MHILFILGIALSILAIALLIFFAFQSLKLKTMEPDERVALSNRLLAINFGAIALATLGLILVFFSLKFKP